jgi:hypothetical protein
LDFKLEHASTFFFYLIDLSEDIIEGVLIGVQQVFGLDL